MDRPNLNSRCRYEPLPPPPSHFLDPNYYPHRPHHRHPDHPFPPPPSPNGHQQHHNGRDLHFSGDQSLRFPYLHRPDPCPYEPFPPPPPPPPPRVHSRIILPEAHPLPRNHLPARGEHFHREFWDDRGFDVDKFRVSDQRPNPIRSEWEQEALQGPLPSYRGPPYLPEGSIDPHVGRKRLFRWDQDGDLNEEDYGAGSQRRPRFWDGHDCHHRHHHRDLIFEQATRDAAFAAASPSSPRGYRFGPAPDRGGGGEASSLFERKLSPPYLLPAGHSRPLPDMGIFDKNSTLDSHSSDVGTDHDCRENHYVDNRGKRRLSGGCSLDSVSTPSRQKRSALSRKQSGLSVWDRIQEKPVLETSPPPPSPPPPPTFTPPSFPEEQHQGMDGLDLSYKSNALVAKVMVPTGSIVPSAEGKGSALQAFKKKVVKKKVVKKRTRVVIPINTSGSELMEGIPKRPISSSPHEVSGHGKVFQKTIVSDDSSQSCPKLVIKTASGNKRTAGRYTDSIILVESDTNDDAWVEVKATSGEEETRKSGNAVVSEIRCTHDSSSQHCQSSFATETSYEKSAAKKSTRAENAVEDGDIKHIEEEEFMTSGERAAQNSSNPMVSDMGDPPPHDASSQSFIQGSTEIMASLDNVAAEGSPKAIVMVENEIAEDPSKQIPRIMEDVENSVHSDRFSTPSIRGSSLSGLGAAAQVLRSIGSATSTISGDSLRGKSIREKEKWQHLDICLGREELKTLGGNSGLDDPSLHSHAPSAVLLPEVEDMDLDQTLIDGAIYDEDNGLSFSVRDGPPESDRMRLGQDHQEASWSESIGEKIMQPLPEIQLMYAEQSYCHLSDSKGCSNDNHHSNHYEKPTSKDDPLLTSKRPLTSEAGEDGKSDKAMLLHLPIPGKAQLWSQHQPKKQITVDLKVAAEESLSRKTNLSYGVERVVPNQVSLPRSMKEIAHSSHSARNKTWHRNNTPSSASASHGTRQFPGSGSMHKQSPKKLSRLHSSYIRKGNSLIRKSSTEVRPLQQAYGLGISSRMSRHVTKRSMNDEIKADLTDHGSCSNPPVERPKTPPLPLGTKLPNCNMNPLRDFPHTTPEDLISDNGLETQVRPLENQTVHLPSGSLDNQNIIVCKTNEPFKTKRMIYVKRKSNQLVAAPGSETGDSSTHPTERAQTFPSTTASDLYYKRKKNQLILSALSSDSQQKRDVISSVDNSNSEDQRTSVVPSLKCNTTSIFKKRLDKVLRTYEHPNFSLVWTSSGERWHKKGATSLNCWKVLPHLFPWKRTIYRKNSISNRASTPNRQSLSFISRKLKLMKKRDTIYKVSTDGYSLRKTGVLSIGGSSLKWSKSIEKRSKKASEEATLAVAEVQRKKRERKRSTSIGSGKKNGNRLPRERIFRVGSARYKMDSSKRTLIRIPDEQASCVIGQQSGNNSQLSFAPRRLLIGNEEYVRIGNGNQLVRDPKQLIRILASEKVRWSLHTARSRLARKKQYCQFFTRFGKCNKNGGKCPYIHDSSKVAICTKFLRGLCSNTSCKLTHKVLPERMPDCSYFLQGLCTNTNCPYRHVNVNPSSPACEGFLKGYCAYGDECQKKHSYVCSLFQATGKCPQGSKCKLHHPRLANKSKKRKLHKVESNRGGRYFGSSITEVGQHLTVDSDERDVEKGGDLFYSDGRFADYISLDVGSDDDGIETNVPMDSHPTQWDSELSRMQPHDLDALIKPVRIMDKEIQLNTSL